MEKITQQIMGLMSWDYYLPILIVIIIITAICLLSGVILLFFAGNPLVIIIGAVGACFLFSHIAVFNEKDPNKFFEYQQKDNEIIEIKSNNLLFKQKADFKIIQNDDEIILKNLTTNEESKPIDKEDFYKIIKIRKSHTQKEYVDNKVENNLENKENKENKESKAFYHKLFDPLEDALGIKER